jgi:uncharacterized protein YecT (DUF1311 family)
MIRTLCLAALLLAGAPALLKAQEKEFCPEGRTQLDMTYCAGEELARADSLLNANYQALVRTLEPHRVRALREAQRAWIRFRDAECAFQESEVRGGSMAPMVYALCEAELSEARAEEFARLLNPVDSGGG